MNIDDLVVTLSLDPKNFTDEQKKALESFRKTQDEFDRRLKNTDDISKKSGDNFKGMTSAAEGLFGVLAGAGMASFARSTMTAAAATGRLATNIGVTVQEASAFGNMIERNGGSAQGAMESLKGYADQVQRVKWGQASPEFLLGFSQVGGAINDSPTDLFFKLAKFAETNTPQDVNLTGQRLGLNQDLINQALKGERQARADFTRGLGEALSPENASKLQRMQESWYGLSQAMTKTGTNALTEVSPAFNAVADSVANWTTKNQGLATSLFTITGSVLGLGVVAGTLGKIVAALRWLGAFKPATWLLRLLGLGVAAVGTPVATALATAGALVVPTNESEEPDIYKNGKLTDYGKKITGQADQGADSGGREAGKSPTSGDKEAVKNSGMAYFQSQGWTKEQAAAIMAQVAHESSYDPNASNNEGGGHKGLFQWGKARRASILKGTGIDVWNADAMTQFRAAQWELLNTEKTSGDGLKKITDAGVGGVWLDRNFERSGDSPEQELRRGHTADRLARERIEDQRTLTAPSATASGRSGTSTSTTEVNVGSVVVQTNSQDPKEHGRQVATEIRGRMDSAGALANQANAGLTP